MVDRDLNVLTDESIVKMAQEGSSTAYEYLIDKYKGLARSKAATYFIVGADKDDVIQEGMIGIFKAVRDFDQEGEASFRTFVELNKSVSLSARPENENDETPALAERLAANSADTDPEVMMLMREVIEFLKANEQNLFSPLENQVWEQMLKGRGYREIAFRLRRSTKTVDNAMQRIKKKVEMYLES